MRSLFAHKQVPGRAEDRALLGMTPIKGFDVRVERKRQKSGHRLESLCHKAAGFFPMREVAPGLKP
jgi:hypothetical protein